MFNVRTSAARTSWHLREHQLGLAASQLHAWCYLIYCCLCMSFSRTRCTWSELGIAAWCKWVEQCETANNNTYQVIHVYVLSNVQTLLLNRSCLDQGSHDQHCLQRWSNFIRNDKRLPSHTHTDTHLSQNPGAFGTDRQLSTSTGPSQRDKNLKFSSAVCFICSHC